MISTSTDSNYHTLNGPRLFAQDTTLSCCEHSKISLSDIMSKCHSVTMFLLFNIQKGFIQHMWYVYDISQYKISHDLCQWLIITNKLKVKYRFFKVIILLFYSLQRINFVKSHVFHRPISCKLSGPYLKWCSCLSSLRNSLDHHVGIINRKN